MTSFFVQPKTSRPDFRLVISFLWDDLHDVDTEGDSDNPASRSWTELYCLNRDLPEEAFDVKPVAGDPLTLSIQSEIPDLAARVAYFLASETGSMVASSISGPWYDPGWLGDKVGSFDLAKARERASRSRWRRSTLANPYPAA